MSEQLDELKLQRLIDGELSDRDRARLLSQLEASASLYGWRSLALRFVENQVLAESFAELDPNAKPRPARSAQSVWRRWSKSVTSVAAAACIGVLSGIVGHYWLNSDVPRERQLVQNVPGTSVPTAVEGTQGTPIPQAPVSIMNPTLASGGSIRVPLPSSAPATEQWQSYPQLRSFTVLPDEVREQLQADGYVVDGQLDWYLAPLSDGGHIVVPAETMRIRPRSRN